MNEWIGSVLLLGGALLCLFAALGVLRLPDFFMRMHAATKAGVAGSGLVLLGVAALHGDAGTWIKAALAVLFLLLTTPVAGHLIGRSGQLDAGHLANGDLSHEDLAPRDQVTADRLTGPCREGPVRVEELPIVSHRDVADEAGDLVVLGALQLHVSARPLVVVGERGVPDRTDGVHPGCTHIHFRADALDLLDQVIPRLEAPDPDAAMLGLPEPSRHRPLLYS